MDPRSPRSQRFTPESPRSDCRLLDLETGRTYFGLITRLSSREIRVLTNAQLRQNAFYRLTYFNDFSSAAVSVIAQVTGKRQLADLLHYFNLKKIKVKAHIPGKAALHEYSLRLSKEQSKRTPPAPRTAQPSRSGHRFKIAESVAEFEQAIRLVHDGYASLGLADSHPSGMYACAQHLLPGTVTFVAVKDGEVAGALTYVHDTALKLPGDRTCAAAFDSLRAPGRRLAEITMFACRARNGERARIFEGLFRAAARHAVRSGNATDLVAAALPDEEKLYRSQGFEPAGGRARFGEWNGWAVLPLRLDAAGLSDKPYVQGTDPDTGRPPAWTMKDVQYLFVKQTGLAKRLTEEEKVLIALYTPQLRLWLENLSVILLYS